MMIVYFFVLFSASSVLEFGSKNASAILSRLRVSRACAYTGIALRAAHPHSSQACLAVSNPSADGNRIRHTPSSGFAQSYAGQVVARETHARDLIFLIGVPDAFEESRKRSPQKAVTHAV